MKCVRRYDFGCVTLGTNLFVTCKLWVDERDFESLDGDGFEKGWEVEGKFVTRCTPEKCYGLDMPPICTRKILVV